MSIVIFQEENILEETLNNFQDLYYGSQMKYLASDLLNEGLSPSEILSAVQKAMTICQTAKMELRQHFIPLYTQIDGMLINDCKLSKLGFGLVLMNAEIYNPTVARYQIKVMSSFLDNL